MVTYTPHYLLQFGGYLGDAQPEIWSCGVRLHSENYSGYDEEAHFNDVIKTAVSAWFARAGSMISNKARLTFCKYNLIDAAGHYSDVGSTREHFYPTPITGASGGAPLPYQCSVVLGWRTLAATRGRASKGRIYSPMPTVVVGGSTGLFPTADALTMATSAALFLNTLDLGYGTSQTIRPHIMSSVDGSYNEINSVVVDSRVDVQRRRAADLVGVEQTVDVLY